MPHSLIYGKLNFHTKHSQDEIINLTYDLLSKSIKHRFGLMLGSNLPYYLLNKMDPKILLSHEYVIKALNIFPSIFWLFAKKRCMIALTERV